MIRTFLIATVAFALSAAGAVAQAFVVQPGDVLSISVLEDPALNREVLVRPDGRISLPLAGSLDVSGQTPEQIEAAVRGRLAREFVTPPSVTVALVRLGPLSAELEDGTIGSVFIMGAVNSPGRYEIELPMTLLQTLAIAGGPNPFAATRRIQVRRQTTDTESVLLFDYRAVKNGLVPSEIIMVRDGDVIIVPERRLFE